MQAWARPVACSVAARCCASAVCVDGTCVHYPEGAAGDPCHRTEVADTCGPGLACEWGDWVCVPLLAAGEPCSGTGQCQGRCNYQTCRCEPTEPYCDEPLVR